jgi:Carboxypeptidase regulatory-like domain
LKVRLIRAFGMGCVMVCFYALPLAAAPGSGRITGVVVDPSGTPQLGATVVVSSEQLASSSPVQLLTNDRGRFTTAVLPVGLYSVKVTLAGFLPAMDEHIQVSSEHTTLLEIVLGSVFSSFEKMRRQPNQTVEPDDWTWVLRSSASTRAVLRWQDGSVVLDDPLADSDSSHPKEIHARLDLLSGGDHPGSIADMSDAPATAFAYDVSVGERGRLLMAGQFSYNGVSPSGGFSTEWIPAGELGTGPVMTLVVRESQLGPAGPVFRGLRISRDDQFTLGDRISIRYGAEFLSAGFDGTTSAFRPRGEVALKLAENWQATALVAAQPWDDNPVMNGALQNVMNALDDFPTLLMRDGRPVLENGWHEEVGLKRSLDKNSDVSAAIFHDASSHTAVLGRGVVTNPDFLQDYYSDAFAYDAGGSDSVGGRVAFRRRFGQNISTTLVYSYAGAMVPLQGSPSGALREMLTTRDLHSLAGRVTATAPRFGTKFAVGYKWINGPSVSGMDAFADSLYHLDPYLSMEIHQPLPPIFQCHMEVMADVGNLLAQGYIPMTTGDGQVELVPSFRYIRGGLSLQF